MNHKLSQTDIETLLKCLENETEIPEDLLPKLNPSFFDKLAQENKFDYQKLEKYKIPTIEYDGLEFHTKRPYEVYSESTFSQEYLEYDIQRQLELESYGYKFLRINKFTLSPKEKGQTELEVLNQLLYTKYRDILYQ